ncbi:MAG: hypothetical protein KDJ77_00610 [Rhodobiaceae bacterium]|nr:hypothetical protein [Rhodobiaceae bacterium]
MTTVGSHIKRKFVAILAADVVGYSRLMGIDEDATLADLKACREVIDPLIESHEGRVFGGAGDSFLAEFASAASAVQCAADIQLAVDTLEAGKDDDRRMIFRIGVNAGEVVVDGEDLKGDEVNIAARLESIAPPGGVYISEAVLDRIDRDLDLEFRDQGEYRVKNIARPVRAFKIPLASEASIASPFRGLDTFEFEHASLFHGRSAAIAATTERLERQAKAGVAFLLIYGMSGAGKSSLLRAGLLPALVSRGCADGVSKCRYCLFRPSEVDDPIDALAAGLTAQSSLPEFAAEALREDLADALRNRPEAVPDLLLAPLGSDAGDREPPENRCRLVIAIDQMEELFTSPSIGADSRAVFIAAIAALAKTPGIWVVATIRADFFHRCGEVAGFSELKDGLGSYELLPPTGSEIRQMIREPARAVGLDFESDSQEGNLADVLHLAAARDPGSLPLLGFVLDALFEADKERRQLTFASYRALGGLEGAIAQRADEVLATVAPPARKALPAVINRLTAVRLQDDTVTSRAVAAGEIAEDPDQRDLTNALLEARLLISANGPGGVPIIRLAHEALLSNWPRARAIVAENREFLGVRSRVEADADRWFAEDCSPDLLLPAGKRLAEAEDILLNRCDGLDQRICAYVEASIAARDAREAAERERAAAEAEAERQRILRDRRRSRMIAAGTTFVAAIMAVLGLVMFGQWQEALRTESQYLADLSHKETREGDAVTGLLLGLEALNDEHSNRLSQILRPHVPAAQGALDAATSAGNWFDRLVIRHPNSVTSIAVTDDGTRVVTGSIDATARLWDASTGNLIRELKGHSDRVFAVAITPDGKRIATGSDDATARVWDADSGNLVSVLSGHDGRVLSVAISADGERVASGSEDTTARIWDVASGKTTQVLRGHRSGLASVAISRDGKRVLTGSWDWTARLWDADTGAVVSEMRGHVGALRSVALSADGTRAVTGSRDETARLWNTDTGDMIAELIGHTDAVFGVAMTPNAEFIVTGSWDKTIRIWDGESGLLIEGIRGHSGIIRGVGVSADGNRIVSGAWDKTARIWDIAGGKQVAELSGHDDEVSTVTMSDDGEFIFTGSADGSIRKWEADTGGFVRTLGVMDDPEHIRISAASGDGRYLVAGSADGTVHLLAAEDGREIADLKGHTDVITGIAFANDSRRFATSSLDGTVRIWNAETRSETNVLNVHKRAVYSVAISADGRYVLTGADEPQTWLWDAETGEQVQSFEGHTDAILTVAMTPDGERMVTGSKDKTVRLWDRRQEHMVTSQIVSGTDPVLVVAVSGDGRRIATGADDGVVRIWDAATGQQLAEYSGHTDAIFSVTFSPDGSRVVTGSADGTARIWNSPPPSQTLIDQSKKAVSRCLTPTQRKQFHLAEIVPKWCFEMGKWPFDDAGETPPSNRMTQMLIPIARQVREAAERLTQDF